MRRLISPLLLAALASGIISGCQKSANPSRNATAAADAISSAKRYFTGNLVSALPNNPQNPRTLMQKTPDWSTAYTANMKSGSVVLVPMRYAKPLYVRFNAEGNRVFCLDNLTKLLIYEDSQHVYHGEVITVFPDSDFVTGHSMGLRGVVFVDDLQGYPLHKYKFQANGIIEYLLQGASTSNGDKIPDDTDLETCTEIEGYNYSPDDPDDGYAWSEENCTQTVLSLSEQVPSGELLDIGSGGGSGNLLLPSTYIEVSYSLNIGSTPITNILQYLQCFTNIAGNSNVYTVSLCVDQPTTGSRTPWDFQSGPIPSSSAGTPVNVGHTFLVFTQAAGSNIIQRNIGFYPVGSVTPNAPLSRGMLNDDESHQYDISLSITVTSSEFFQMLTAAEAPGMPAPFMYNLDTDNCSSFALNVFAVAGINLPRTTGTWLGGSGYDPGDLGEDIRAMPLTSNESRSTTNTAHPNIGTCQ